MLFIGTWLQHIHHVSYFKSTSVYDTHEWLTVFNIDFVFFEFEIELNDKQKWKVQYFDWSIYANFIRYYTFWNISVQISNLKKNFLIFDLWFVIGIHLEFFFLHAFYISIHLQRSIRIFKPALYSWQRYIQCEMWLCVIFTKFVTTTTTTKMTFRRCKLFVCRQ